MSHRRSLRVLIALVGAVALTTTGAFAAGIQDPIPDPIPPAGVDIALKTVASGLVSPVAAARAPGDGHHLSSPTRTGCCGAVDGVATATATATARQRPRPRRQGKWLVADLSGLLVDDLAKVIPGLPYDERGFLGVAFDPRFKHNGLLYTFTSENPTAPPDFTTQPGEAPGGGQAVVTEWAVRNPDAKQITVDPASRRVLMRVDKPQFNHNGGELAFGPDKMLYISLGDGGNADDEGPGHVPGGNAQSLAAGNVLGKVLRIDPHGSNSANGQYGIPAGNPFVGAPGADEIWAYGFRNPYRFSFDRSPGGSWWQTSGRTTSRRSTSSRPVATTAGRSRRARSSSTTGGPDPVDGSVTANSPGAPAGLSDPIASTTTPPRAGSAAARGAPPSACQGIAVVGGYVAKRVHGLKGHYVFGDYSRAFAQPLGRLFVLRHGQVEALPDPGIAVFGFGQDKHGDLYVLGNTTGAPDRRHRSGAEDHGGG